MPWPRVMSVVGSEVTMISGRKRRMVRTISRRRSRSGSSMPSGRPRKPTAWTPKTFAAARCSASLRRASSRPSTPSPSAPLSPLVTKQYVTSAPSAAHLATVPPQKYSGSSGWAITTRTCRRPPEVTGGPATAFPVKAARPAAGSPGAVPSGIPKALGTGVPTPAPAGSPAGCEARSRKAPGRVCPLRGPLRDPERHRDRCEKRDEARSPSGCPLRGPLRDAERHRDRCAKRDKARSPSGCPLRGPLRDAKRDEERSGFRLVFTSAGALPGRMPATGRHRLGLQRHELVVRLELMTHELHPLAVLQCDDDGLLQPQGA